VAKRKVTKREGHPGWRFPSIHGRKVREPVPGFSSGHPARAKRRCHPWQRPLRGLIVPASPPPRGPGKAARILRALLEEPEQEHGAPHPAAPRQTHARFRAITRYTLTSAPVTGHALICEVLRGKCGTVTSHPTAQAFEAAKQTA